MPAIVARAMCPAKHVIVTFVKDGLSEKEAWNRERIKAAANATNIAMSMITNFGFAEPVCAVCGAGHETWKIAARAEPDAGDFVTGFGEGVKMSGGEDMKAAFERLVRWGGNRLKPRESHRHGRREKEDGATSRPPTKPRRKGRAG